MESMSLGNEDTDDYFTNMIRCTKCILPEGYRNIKRIPEVLNVDHSGIKVKDRIKILKSAEHGGREQCAEYSAYW
jgi:hypothetical protein